MTSPLDSFLHDFPKRRVLVVGDAILDHYVIGRVERTSPEAPVPVLFVEREDWLPGGAANVARNLAAQDASVVFVSLCGNDEAGTRLQQLLARDKKITLEIHRDKSRPTTLKTRCVAQGQQMIRLDRELPGPASREVVDRITASIKKHISRVDGVILSDYGKGLLTPALISEIIRIAETESLEVIVDPKGTDYTKYLGATLLTPNRKEAQDASGVSISDEASTQEAARVLNRKVGGKGVVITLGAGGVAVFPRRGQSTFIPARAREVYDVTGAGDTFISLLSLARFTGADFVQSAEIGNIAAGIVVGRAGVATVTREELLREMSGGSSQRKAMTLRELREVRDSLRRAGRKVVLTNGCFDVLNVRHIRLLEQARALGDVLVVALNSDASVRKLKGEPRPLLTEGERVELISALPSVDYVTVFDGDTPREVLMELKPDILVKGDNVSEVVGSEIVKKYGGEVRQLDLGFGPTVEDVIRRASEGAASPMRKRKRRV